MSRLFRGGKIPKGKQMQKLVAAQVRERVEAAVRKENEARAHAQGRGADVPSACLPMRDTGSGGVQVTMPNGWRPTRGRSSWPRPTGSKR